MKFFICTMLSMLSILANVCAQTRIFTSIGSSFNASTDHTERRFWIDLGKGNRLCLELEDHNDLGKFTNIDSLLKPPLPDADRAKLQKLFEHLRGVGLEAPAARAR